MPTATETKAIAQIKISQETWRRLNALRQTSSESFDALLARLLDERREAATPQ